MTVTPSRLIHLSLSADGSSLRTSTMNGVSYIICPVISKVGDRVEWPINAPTPEYIPSEVLTFATESRNNRPVVMGHPKRDGSYVSANDPGILERYCFGHVFNASYSEGCIYCEIWLDKLKASVVDSHLGGTDAQRVIERLESGETVEVSEGNYVVIDRVEGKTDSGQEYGAIWRLCIGDHLAVLGEDQIGACAIADGCGAGTMRSSEVSTSSSTSHSSGPWSYPLSLSVSILAQARRPAFSGTESTSWSAPSFSEYVKYLHEGKEGPSSVSQASSDLKRKIAAHSLLGDPEAGNLSDLAFFPCVNPSNGKLNEKALRAILGGRGSDTDIPEKAKVSAQDMARRLLNSEFGTELEVSMKGDVKSIRAAFSRAMRVLGIATPEMKSSSAPPEGLSNDDLEWKLHEALRAVTPAFDGVSCVYQESNTVIYSSTPEGYGSPHWWSRTYGVADDGSVTLNNDVDEVTPDMEWKPIAKSEDSKSEIVLSDSCTCQNKGDSIMDRKVVISRLSSLPMWKDNVKALEAMTDETLGEVSRMCESADGKKDEGVEKATAVTETEKQKETTPPATPVTPITSPPSTPASTPTSNISPEELADLKQAAAKYRAAENAHRTTLIGRLKDSSEFAEERLKAMTTEDLETLSRSLKLEDSSSAPQYDFSGRGLPVAVPGTTTARKAPDTWKMSADRYAEKKKAAS